MCRRKIEEHNRLENLPGQVASIATKHRLGHPAPTSQNVDF